MMITLVQPNGKAYIGKQEDKLCNLSMPVGSCIDGTHTGINQWMNGFIYGVWGSKSEFIYQLCNQ